MRSSIRSALAGFSLCVCVPALNSCAGDGRGSDPVVDNSSTSRALQQLPRPMGERVSVGIYEFRSVTSEVTGRDASDMFVTALVRSGQFTVVERSRINQNVMREKQMNAAGQTTGNTAQQQLLEARYLFEGVVSEVNRNQSNSSNAVTIGGAKVGGGSATDVIAVDVRIIDAGNGAVLDSVAVRKEVGGGSTAVSGLGALASNYLSSRGKTPSQFMPEVDHQSSRKENVDAAVRSCMEAAVLELAKRLQRPQ